MPDLAVIVHGTPAPQGSKRHVGNGVLVESSAKVAPWREAVRHATEVAILAQDWAPPLTPSSISLVFTLIRPRSHYRTGRNSELLRDGAPRHPAGRPDLDKLVRATLDGLVDGGALADDAHIYAIQATKCYPGGHLYALDTPGADLVIRTP